MLILRRFLVSTDYYFISVLNKLPQSKDSAKEPNMFHNYKTEKITRKDRDVWFSRPRSSCTTHLILFSERPPVVHDDLGWKNRTTRYNCRYSVASLALRVIFVRRKRPPIYKSCMTISGGGTEQRVIRNRFWRVGCSRLEYTEIRSVY